MKFAKVMFLHLSVSHSVHRGCLPQCMLGYTPQPLGADTPPPPGAGTPFTVHAGRYGQQAGSTYPTGMHTCAVARFNVAPEHLSSRTRFLTPPIVNSECPPP